MLCVVTCEMYKLFSISIILVRFAYIQQKKNNERHQQKKRKVQTSTQKYWHGTHAVSSVKHAKYKRRENFFSPHPTQNHPPL